LLHTSAVKDKVAHRRFLSYTPYAQVRMERD